VPSAIPNGQLFKGRLLKVAQSSHCVG